MTFKRLLPCATAVAFVLIVSPSFAQETGGGAVALPQAGAAQDDTPTTPGGEEQPPQEQPDGEQPPTTQPNAEPSPTPEAGVGGGSAGGLPQTGWQAFALASIGLGLLLAGAALRPTSSWPPPRDRLTRSPMRR
ncbi:MAG TPA: hypothetical protein VF072_06405 [Thermoleophilaceae bacterium]